MRKGYLMKRGVACVLSAAMVLTGAGISPGGTKTASAADIPAAIATYDFSSSDGLTISNTGTADKPFEIADGVLKMTDSKNFVTYTNPLKGQVTENAVIDFDFKISDNASDNNINYGTILGFETPNVAVVSGAYFCYNGDGVGWVDVKKDPLLKKGEKHHYTVVINKTSGITIYIDGLKANVTVNKSGDDFTDDKQGEAILNSFNTSNEAYFGKGAFWDAADGELDNVKFFNQGMTDAQVFEMVTGKTLVNADRTNLAAAIKAAEAITRTELYTDDTAKAFIEKLTAAQTANSDLSTTQEVIDTATSELTAAQTALVKKSVNLADGLVLNSDMTTATSTVDKENKKVTAGGYDINALGISTVEDGYIQSSTDGAAQKAGISLDKSLLDGVTLDTGLTFNIKWRFSTAPATDWWDLISIVDANKGYLMRNTVGFVTFAGTGKENVFPGSDCKNGFAWDSCKSYATDADKNLTVTIDKTGFRMYVDGVLACEKKDMTAYDFDSVFAGAAEIFVGYAVNTADGDLQGQLKGLQVYHRALNAAEVDELNKSGVAEKTVTATVQTKPNTEVVVKKGDTVVAKVTTDAEGKAVVKGLVNGAEYTCTITNEDGTTLSAALTAGTDTPVEVKAPLTGIAFKEASVELENQKLGDTLVPASKELTIEYTPANTTDDKTITYTSSDEKVVTVDSTGKVTAVAESGTATITATSVNGLTATCTVTVKTTEVKDAVFATGISIDKQTETVDAGKTVQLTAAITPENVTIKDCDWSTSDAKIATVDSKGLVTGVAAGEATITATTKDGTKLTASCKVTVKAPAVAVTAIKLDKETASLKVGEKVTLIPSITPDNATDKTVVWKSSDNTIATVDNGTVTAVKAGKVEITATAKDNDKISAKCTVTVTEDGGNTNPTDVETLTGTAWWTGNQVGKDYELKGDGSIKLNVEVAEAYNNETAFNAELVGADAAGTKYYLTTGSLQDAWNAEGSKDVGTITINKGTPTALVVGHTYSITATRAGQDFNVKYYDETAKEDYCEFVWKGSNMPETVNLHIIAQLGTFKVSKVTDGGDKPGGDTPGGDETKASLSLSKSKATLYTGKASNKTTVKATVAGASKTVSWTSSKPKVAKVSKTGSTVTITAVGKGTTTITATANGIKKTVKVTVKNPTITVKNGKKKVGKSLTVKKKKAVKLTITTSPKKAGATLAKLSKKNKKVLTASLKKGKLTIKGKKKGTVTLSIKSGKATKKIKVKVK